jgi:hypothetical protein
MQMAFGSLNGKYCSWSFKLYVGEGTNLDNGLIYEARLLAA